MEALRAIVDSQQLASIIDLPFGLRNREVEVIVLPSKPAQSEPVQREEIPPKTVCFTDEQREQFRQHREKCVAEHELQRQGKPRMTHEEFLEFLNHGPVADEETIQLQDEVREEMKRWKMV